MPEEYKIYCREHEDSRRKDQRKTGILAVDTQTLETQKRNNINS
jgi:hypothetical protein